MTTVAVLADPPRPGVVLSSLVERTPLDDTEAADLYAAMCRDVCRAVVTSGGDLLVNYRDDDQLPDADRSSEEDLQYLLEDIGDDVRFEVQVGESFAARAGNTVSHLLDREGVKSAAVVEPTAALLSRGIVDSAAMKLRTRDIVLGPTTTGGVYFAGFTESVDFEDAYAPPTVETLTDRGRDAGLDVDFLEMQPTAESDGLATLVSVVRARKRAGRIVPQDTANQIAELGLRVAVDGGDRRVVRD